MEEKIKKLSEKYLERVMELRRELHKYPEIGFDLFKTAEIVKIPFICLHIISRS